jgi:hypothetical protein
MENDRAAGHPNSKELVCGRGSVLTDVLHGQYTGGFTIIFPMSTRPVTAGCRSCNA